MYYEGIKNVFTHLHAHDTVNEEDEDDEKGDPRKSLKRLDKCP